MTQPIGNLAEKGFKSKFLFIIPGTDIEVSVARVGASSDMPDLKQNDFMVYFRKAPDRYPNAGYIHINANEKVVDFSVTGMDLTT